MFTSKMDKKNRIVKTWSPTRTMRAMGVGTQTAHKEPTLFPSKTQRDWSKFGINDQETKHQFKPFDKVLVRDDDDTTWRCDFFSHLGDKEGVFICLTTWWHQCIPYEGNEHLLGTTNNPEE